MQNKWNRIDSWTDKLRVPGGWVISVHGDNQTLCFVPDPRDDLQRNVSGRENRHQEADDFDASFDAAPNEAFS